MRKRADNSLLPGLMTEKEAAAFFRLSVRGLMDWRNRGLVPYLRIGRSIRYRRSSLEAMLDRMELGGP